MPFTRPGQLAHPQLIPLAFTIQPTPTPSFIFAHVQGFFVTLPFSELPQKLQLKVVLESDCGYRDLLVAMRLARLKLIFSFAIFKVKITAAI